MAITSITIENFKGIGDAVTIPIRPITLLFGKNSAGKSTVLQALLYMCEVCEHAGADADRTPRGGGYIDLGGFPSLAHIHKLDRKIRIRIEFDLTAKESESLNRFLDLKTNPDSAWIEAVTSWDGEKENVYTESYEFGLNGTGWIRLILTERPEARSSDAIDSNGAEWNRLNNAMFLNIKHPDTEHIIVDDSFKKMLTDKLSMLRGIALEELSDIRYLGPIRKLPPRNYKPQKTPDESLWAEGLEAWNTLGRDPELVKKINRYMRDVLKLGYSISRQRIIPLDRDGDIMENLKKYCNSKDFDVDELKRQIRDLIDIHPEIRMKLHDEENNVDLDPIDVGLGISQVIPVLVGALHCDRPDPKKFYLSKPPGGFFAVEQPELHLHPAAQMALSDMFIDSIKYNRLHHLIQVTLKRIRDHTENSDHYEELFKIIKENRGRPDIQSAIEKYLSPDIQRFFEEPSYSMLDLQSAIKECLKKGKNNSPDIQRFFEVLSYSINSSYRTMLIETHSEHLLLRLLRRVREKTRRSRHQTAKVEQTDHELTPNDLSVVYVRPTPAGVKFTPLTVTNNGDFDAPWPEGFFEERESEWY